MATLAVLGMDLLLKKLNALPRLVKAELMDNALMAAANVIKDAAQSKVPVDTGRLRASIDVIRERAKRAEHRVTVKCWEGGGHYAGWQFYGAFWEYGFRRGKRTDKFLLVKREVVYKGRKKQLVKNAEWTGVDNRPIVPARPFMRPAFDENIHRCVELISTELGSAIEAEASK